MDERLKIEVERLFAELEQERRMRIEAEAALHVHGDLESKLRRALQGEEDWKRMWVEESIRREALEGQVARLQEQLNAIRRSYV